MSRNTKFAVFMVVSVLVAFALAFALKANETQPEWRVPESTESPRTVRTVSIP